MNRAIAYVAGPYRGPCENDVLENITRARDLAVQLWRAGFVVVCPHMNTAMMGGVVPDNVFLEGDVEIMRRCCDCLVTVRGWETSTGTCEEIDLMRRYGRPVFHSVEDAVCWRVERFGA